MIDEQRGAEIMQMKTKNMKRKKGVKVLNPISPYLVLRLGLTWAGCNPLPKPPTRPLPPGRLSGISINHAGFLKYLLAGGLYTSILRGALVKLQGLGPGHSAPQPTSWL